MSNPKRRFIKRGQRYVTKHVGTDNCMSTIGFRRTLAQSLRNIVELNHRSEVHFMLVAYDPRNENPSLTFYGPRDVCRAALRSNLKDEICNENPPKQIHKTTLRIPVFAPRDTSELSELVDKEVEENALTNYWYKEMQRCLFPMQFFKQKANDSWVPRENLAFWPHDLEVHTLHEPEFGIRRTGCGPRITDRTNCLIYILQYLKDYYHDVVLRSLQLEMCNTEDGFSYVNSEDWPDEEIDRCSEIADRELCTRLFVSWILRPLRIAAEDSSNEQPDVHDFLESTSGDDPNKPDEEMFIENAHIDVCSVEDNTYASDDRSELHSDHSHMAAKVPCTGDNNVPVASTSANPWTTMESLARQDLPAVSKLTSTKLGEETTMIVRGKCVTVRKVKRSELINSPGGRDLTSTVSSAEPSGTFKGDGNIPGDYLWNSASSSSRAFTHQQRQVSQPVEFGRPVESRTLKRTMLAEPLFHIQSESVSNDMAEVVSEETVISSEDFASPVHVHFDRSAGFVDSQSITSIGHKYCFRHSQQRGNI